MKKKKPLAKRILIIILIILLVCVGAFGVIVLVLTVTEYKPAAVESLTVEGTAEGAPAVGDSLRVMTWNIGYGALGDNADFFMDGGKSVTTATKDRVNENMAGIIAEVRDVDPDVVFFQEMDTDADRSYRIDESAMVREAFPAFDSTFAYNFKVLFVPYPIPPMGKESAGIQTISRYDIASADRIQLPCPFKYPVRLGNLKRCLAINRIPLEGSDKELVMVNLHLEAYDSGEGKKAQTEMLRDYLQAEMDAGNYVIAGGDFNQIFSNAKKVYPELEGTWHAGELDTSAFDSRFTFLMDTDTPSCRSLDKAYAGADTDSSKFQYYSIDGFIVSDNIRIDSVVTQDLQFKNADHNPVVLDVTLE